MVVASATAVVSVGKFVEPSHAVARLSTEGLVSPLVFVFSGRGAIVAAAGHLPAMSK